MWPELARDGTRLGRQGFAPESDAGAALPRTSVRLGGRASRAINERDRRPARRFVTRGRAATHTTHPSLPA